MEELFLPAGQFFVAAAVLGARALADVCGLGGEFGVGREGQLFADEVGLSLPLVLEMLGH